MKLDSFRITNFRSIVDTDWCRFSPDGVTVLVGQNESRKTAVLAALNTALSDSEITEDDIRTGAELPKVYFRLILSESELNECFADYHASQVITLKRYLKAGDWAIVMFREWEKSADAGKGYQATLSIEDDDKLKAILDEARPIDPASSEQPAETPAEQPAETPAEEASETPGEEGTETPAKEVSETSESENTVKPLDLTIRHVVENVYKLTPKSTLFDQETGLLPSSIDINSDGTLQGDGAVAANNFLSIANLKVKDLLTEDLRTQTEKLERANKKISDDFAAFWTQTIGKSGPLKLQCELHHYGTNVPDKSGQPHLVFWISDGLTKLYFKQRSLGVRWFMSFYLQLKASELRGGERIFLLDEPGANLHSRAQSDVLKLINRLSKDIKIIYCTHSPDLIEYDKFYRIHAVQRDGDVEATPTRIIGAHRLGTASQDTLSPVLTAMGMDLSSQNVIRKINNVILEEMSGFYYLTAFWKLTNELQEAHFIATSGVNKVEPLAYMFRGWGLGFIVALDDESSARKVYNKLKRELYGDDEEVSRANMIKFKDCKGIEDVFSKNDFRVFILNDTNAKFENNNSEFLKTSSYSKPVLAYQFLLKVDEGDISWDDLNSTSQARIKKIVSDISSRLKPKQPSDSLD